MSNVNVHINEAAVVARIKAASDVALTVLGIQALKDANQYVPRDQGLLENSGIINSDTHAQDGVFTLRWDEPYARYQYYGVAMEGRAPKQVTDRPLKYTKPEAKKMWAHHAQAKHGDEWNEMYQKALKEELGK